MISIKLLYLNLINSIFQILFTILKRLIEFIKISLINTVNK